MVNHVKYLTAADFCRWRTALAIDARNILKGVADRESDVDTDALEAWVGDITSNAFLTREFNDDNRHLTVGDVARMMDCERKGSLEMMQAILRDDSDYFAERNAWVAEL